MDDERGKPHLSVPKRMRRERLLSKGTIQDITKIAFIEDKLEQYSKHLEAMVGEKVREISESQMATIYLVKLSELKG